MLSEADKEHAMIIAKNLQRLMDSRGVRAVDVYTSIGIKKTTYSSWVTGKSVPRMDKVVMLCDYFNCSVADLVEEENTETQIVTIEVHSFEDHRRIEQLRKIMKHEEKRAILGHFLDALERDIDRD